MIIIIRTGATNIADYFKKIIYWPLFAAILTALLTGFAWLSSRSDAKREAESEAQGMIDQREELVDRDPRREERREHFEHLGSRERRDVVRHIARQAFEIVGVAKREAESEAQGMSIR